MLPRETGVKGVYPREYVAWGSKDGTRCYLGTFDTVEKAQQAVESFDRGEFISTRKDHKPRRRKTPHECGSDYRGITKVGNKWRLQITRTFDSEEEAARAYDQIATLLWGEDAILNFPEGT